MKTIKYLGMLLLVVACCVGVSSCKDKDDEENTPQKNAESYIGVKDGNFVQGSIPGVTDSETKVNVTSNSNALAGGANIVTVESPVPLLKFFAGIEGLDGYFEVSATPVSRAESTVYVYDFTITYTTELDRDLTIIVRAQTESGGIVGVMQQQVTYVTSQSGDLTINLVFDQAKDVDLHLVLPEGAFTDWIYYGNRGISNEVSEETEEAIWQELLAKYGYSADTDEDEIDNENFWMEYEARFEELGGIISGLDHDSNPGCYIDNLNNENIVIKAEHLIPGTYKVYVNMYENCTSEEPTNWTCITRFLGNLIGATEGANPATGKFAADAFSNYNDYFDKMTLATTFTLTQAQIDQAKAGTRASSGQSDVVMMASIGQRSLLKMMDSGRWDTMKHHRKAVRR